MDEKENLYWRIVELEKKYTKNQRIRTLLIIGGYTIAVFCVGNTIIGGVSSIEDFIALVFASVMIAGFAYIINLSIFMWKFSHNQEENRELNYLEERYKELCRKRKDDEGV